LKPPNPDFLQLHRMSHRFASCAAPAGRRSTILLTFALLGSSLGGLGSAVASAAGESTSAPVQAPAAVVSRSFYIKEFQVQGVKHIPAMDVEDAVYPYMGPERTVDDVEKARVAVEKLYRDKGYQAVAVQIPPQQVKGGVVILHVDEGTVGRLRVKDSRYYSLTEIKKAAPSLAEGEVLNFNNVNRDIVALNQLPDRRVTPSLRAGTTPGTFDVDLNVKDSPPLHASLELNNRYSPNTTQLRVNGGVSYANLWQLGHTLGFNFQIAPERIDDAKVFSGFYLIHLPETPWLSLMAQATKQDSNISTLGGSAVAGRGQTAGFHALMTLPPVGNFFHSVNVGIDYKHYDQDLLAAKTTTSSPITYYPLSAIYSGSWTGKKSVTEFNIGPTLGLRQLGSDQAEFTARRSGSSGDFIYLRGDVSLTRDLPAGFQYFGKIQGQASSEPLIDPEQFSGGGLDTARGYLEGVAAGDLALFGTVELRSPSVLSWLGEKSGEWRFYGFGDAGVLGVEQNLPGQTQEYNFLSVGVGSRLRFRDHFTGSVDAGVPLKSVSPTRRGDVLLTFRIGADY